MLLEVGNVLVRSKRGWIKCVHGGGVDRVTGLTTIFESVTLMLYFSVKKYGGGMILI